MQQDALDHLPQRLPDLRIAYNLPIEGTGRTVLGMERNVVAPEVPTVVQRIHVDFYRHCIVEEASHSEARKPVPYGRKLYQKWHVMSDIYSINFMIYSNEYVSVRLMPFSGIREQFAH